MRPRPLLALTIPALVLATTAVAGGSEGVRLFLDPPRLDLGAGERRTVAVRVEGIPEGGLAAFQVLVRFDPAAVEVLDPNAAYVAHGVPAFAPLGDSPLCSAVRGLFRCPDPRWILAATGRTAHGLASIDRANGRLTIAYGSAGENPPPGGDGTLALIEVVGRASGRASLEIVESILADRSDPPRTYQAEPGLDRRSSHRLPPREDRHRRLRARVGERP